MTSTLFSSEREAMSRSESNIGKPDLGVTDKAKLKIFKTGIPILLTLTPIGSRCFQNVLQSATTIKEACMEAFCISFVLQLGEIVLNSYQHGGASST